MTMESTIETNGDKRSLPLHYLIVTVAIACGGGYFTLKSVHAQRSEMASAKATVERENLRNAELETLKAKLLVAQDKESQACINAAGVHYPEERAEHELARLRGIDLCVKQLAKPRIN